MLKNVIIDPGHGGRHTGAVVKAQHVIDVEIPEKAINLIASDILREQLESIGHKVYMTRTTDTHFSEGINMDLAARCVEPEGFDADCFVSVHCNWYKDPDVHGFEIWTSPGLTDADELADGIYLAVEDVVNPKMRPDLADGDYDREEHLYVLDHTTMPAVLLELDFMSNPEALEKLTNHDYLERMMQAVAMGITSWAPDKKGVDTDAG
jgi:N-acetylmuramoyl-L-alanine amidase